MLVKKELANCDLMNIAIKVADYNICRLLKSEIHWMCKYGNRVTFGPLDQYCTYKVCTGGWKVFDFNNRQML